MSISWLLWRSLFFHGTMTRHLIFLRWEEAARGCVSVFDTPESAEIAHESSPLVDFEGLNKSRVICAEVNSSSSRRLKMRVVLKCLDGDFLLRGEEMSGLDQDWLCLPQGHLFC